MNRTWVYMIDRWCFSMGEKWCSVLDGSFANSSKSSRIFSSNSSISLRLCSCLVAWSSTVVGVMRGASIRLRRLERRSRGPEEGKSVRQSRRSPREEVEGGRITILWPSWCISPAFHGVGLRGEICCMAAEIGVKPCHAAQDIARTLKNALRLPGTT